MVGLLVLGLFVVVGLATVGGVVAGAIGLSRKARWGLPVLIVSLVLMLALCVLPVVSIGVITVFGNQIRDQFQVSTERLGGDDDAALDSSITDDAGAKVRRSMADLKDDPVGDRPRPARPDSRRDGSRE